MAEMALYRKYRPRTFGGMVGQGKVTRSIRHAFMADRLTHAFLFTGKKGSGKTTAAKLLAKLLNCEAPESGEPCNACGNCLAADAGTHPDIREQDAASNRGIDNVRQMVAEISYRPTMGGYRVTIMDEAHMLTTEAFNALLKTIEDPPPGVVFILVTTEYGKIPATVASRCQTHLFTPLPPSEIAATLARIAKAEGAGGGSEIMLSESGADAIAAESDGSLRDALVTLQQVRDYAGDGEIDSAVVYDLLGKTGSATLARVVDLAIAGDMQGLLSLAVEITDDGTDTSRLVSDLGRYLHAVFLSSVGEGAKLPAYIDRAAAEAAAGHAKEMGTAGALRAMETVSRAAWRLGTNAAPRVVLESTFAYLAFPEYDTGDIGVASRLEGLESRMGKRIDRLAKVIDLLSE